MNGDRYYFFGQSRDGWVTDWGGKVDENETSWYALYRELKEEATSWADALMKFLALGPSKPVYFLSEHKSSIRVLILLEIPEWHWRNVRFQSDEHLRLKVVHRDAMFQFLQDTKHKNRGIHHFNELLTNGLLK